MIDILFGVAITAGIYFALRYIRQGKHCNHNCTECRHPCRTRT